MLLLFDFFIFIFTPSLSLSFLQHASPPSPSLFPLLVRVLLRRYVDQFSEWLFIHFLTFCTPARDFTPPACSSICHIDYPTSPCSLCSDSPSPSPSPSLSLFPLQHTSPPLPSLSFSLSPWSKEKSFDPRRSNFVSQVRGREEEEEEREKKKGEMEGPRVEGREEEGEGVGEGEGEGEGESEQREQGEVG